MSKPRYALRVSFQDGRDFVLEEGIPDGWRGFYVTRMVVPASEGANAGVGIVEVPLGMVNDAELEVAPTHPAVIVASGLEDMELNHEAAGVLFSEYGETRPCFCIWAESFSELPPEFPLEELPASGMFGVEGVVMDPEYMKLEAAEGRPGYSAKDLTVFNLGTTELVLRLFWAVT